MLLAGVCRTRGDTEAQGWREGHRVSLRLQSCEDGAQGWREVATSPRTPKLVSTTGSLEAGKTLHWNLWKEHVPHQHPNFRFPPCRTVSLQF